MFCGIVQGSWPLARNEVKGEGRLLSIVLPLKMAQSWRLGDSVALNGVCLTIMEKREEAGEVELFFELSPESIRLSQLAEVPAGEKVHVESAMKMGDPIGGHLVSGHVDCIGHVECLESLGDYVRFVVSIPVENRLQLQGLLVKKGSVAIDGVSLTVNSVKKTKSLAVEMMLIPHTLERTRFSTLKKGDRVNVEIDQMAKYVRQYIEDRYGEQIK